MAEVRDWLAAHVPTGPLPSVDTAEGFERHREWERALAAARLSVVSWPAEYGGRDASLLEWLVFEEEYYAAGAPVRVGQNGLFLLAPTLFAHGTPEQRDRLLPPMARADEIWAQAWSEPEAGSDLAAHPVPRGRDRRRLAAVGQKTWSSRAAFADRAFGLFRSRPGGARSAASGITGLTYLLFDLRAPGVTVRPIRQLDGETGFAEIFLDDVFVPDADVIGAPGDGWRIAMSTAEPRARPVAAQPRPVPRGRRPAGRAVAARPATRPTPPPRTGSPTRGSARAPTSCTPTRPPPGWPTAATLGAEASMSKVFWSELDIALHETALDLLGPQRRDPAATAGSRATCSRWPGRSTPAPTRSSAP